MIEKLMELVDFLDNLSDEEKKYVYANINKLIERYNEKYNKNILVRF